MHYTHVSADSTAPRWQACGPLGSGLKRSFWSSGPVRDLGLCMSDKLQVTPPDHVFEKQTVVNDLSGVSSTFLKAGLVLRVMRSGGPRV